MESKNVQKRDTVLLLHNPSCRLCRASVSCFTECGLAISTWLQPTRQGITMHNAAEISRWVPRPPQGSLRQTPRERKLTEPLRSHDSCQDQPLPIKLIDQSYRDDRPLLQQFSETEEKIAIDLHLPNILRSGEDNPRRGALLCNCEGKTNSLFSSYCSSTITTRSSVPVSGRIFQCTC